MARSARVLMEPDMLERVKKQILCFLPHAKVATMDAQLAQETISIHQHKNVITWNYEQPAY